MAWGNQSWGTQRTAVNVVSYRKSGNSTFWKIEQSPFDFISIGKVLENILFSRVFLYSYLYLIVTYHNLDIFR